MAIVKSFVVPLTLHDVLDFELRYTRGRVVAFAVNYRALIDGDWVEVVRYDTAHGAAHVHRFWRPPGRRIEALPDHVATGPDLASGLAHAERDLRQNWRKYRRRMEEVLR